MDNSSKKGFAITSLVLGILSVVGGCCCLHLILAPLSLIFGIISLASKRGGKGMAITGIVLSVLMIVFTGFVAVSFKDVLKYSDTISNDMAYIINNQDEVFKEYEEDGTLPDCLDKYTEPPLSDILESRGVSIQDIMDALDESYKNGQLPANISGYGVAENVVYAD